ncbi:hypothetical protein BOTBODRAFT_33832 [Botryobasidium botryosum FD-172 SS1]|uniref:RNA polymerase II transcription factor B subunit 3 n=1 Tax=Botryobasidium botryosum (strain FD-172 SS1) TaxID=930990 RepID=A0A067MMW9_BOTB1|nr:hypothetical protein BOTBODRAFT_33832 [Botryobasidium botryosum FD-172 SS1]
MSSSTRLNWLKTTTRQRNGASSSATATSKNVPTVYNGGVKDASGRTSEYSSMDDECPVCKSDRYLNPKLRLLVSTCYHKMCESCIDRLFTLGPQGCPICGKILRKMAFAPQTFEDLTVEKEVAVRRRIAKEFNKRREDFADLRSYNDYLEEVEDITFNLINEIDVAETEARIAAFRRENAALIELNIQREERDIQGLQEQEMRERREREEMAEEMRRIAEEERIEREKAKEEIINRLESSDASATDLIAKSRAEAAKRAARRKPLAGLSASSARARLNGTAHSAVQAQDVPHVPLTDTWYACEDKYVLRAEYDDPLSERVRADEQGAMRAGGYMLEQAWERALRTAVMGLNIMPLEDEPASGSARVAGDVEMVG